MVCTFIDHRNDVNMFNTQVEPRHAGELFHCKEYSPWKIVVDLFLSTTLTVLKSISIKVSQNITSVKKSKTNCTTMTSFHGL